MMLLVGGDAPVARAVAAHAMQPLIATTRQKPGGADLWFFDLAADPTEWKLPEAEAACIFARARPGNALVNVDRTTALIDRLHAAGSYVLFLSTDRVFDGSTPRCPTLSPTAPTDDYGREKVAVEQHIARYPDAAVLRVGKVLPREFPLFVGWRKSLAANRSFEAFEDLATAPVPMDLVARTILRMLGERPPGIFQLSAGRDVTYLEIAVGIADIAGASIDLVRPARAPLPRRYASLDSSRLVTEFGLTLPDPMDVAMEAAGA